MRVCAIRNARRPESDKENRRAYLREYNREYGKRKRICPKCGKLVSCKQCVLLCVLDIYHTYFSYADHVRRHNKEKSRREKKSNFAETTVQCTICLQNVRNCKFVPSFSLVSSLNVFFSYIRHLQRHENYKEEESSAFASQRPKVQVKESGPIPCNICQKKITRNKLAFLSLSVIEISHFPVSNVMCLTYTAMQSSGHQGSATWSDHRNSSATCADCRIRQRGFWQSTRAINVSCADMRLRLSKRKNRNVRTKSCCSIRPTRRNIFVSFAI